MRKIETRTAFCRAMKEATDLCRQTHTTYYVLHDSIDEPGDYRVSDCFPTRPQSVRFSAEWTGDAVHGTRG